MSRSPFRVTVTGPMMNRAGIVRTVESEFEQANRDALGLVRSRANLTVHRDQGVYERGWQPPVSTFGAGFGPTEIVSTSMENTAPHAGVQEDGRRPGSYTPYQPLIDWMIRRGIRPRAGVRPEDYLNFARAISAIHHARGWPHAGSYAGGYLGPPRPVQTALEREHGPIMAAYDRAGLGIARRLGS